MLAALHGLSRHVRIDQVECLWEPYMILAARLREAFGLPGMTVEQTLPFRDKEQMKRTLDAAGIRTPWHASATTVAGVWEAAEKIGYPLIVKPIAGAGSADTYRVDSRAALGEVLPLLRHVPEVSVEEFVEARGVHLRHGLRRRPDPVRARAVVPAAPAADGPARVGQPGGDLAARLDVPHLQGGRRMGEQVLAALGFDTGFTHMEWYRKPDGEVVFGEIGARPPGVRVVDLMNFNTDGDVYVGWAEAVVHGRMRQLEHQYNVGSICKRARGVGPDHVGAGHGRPAVAVRRRTSSSSTCCRSALRGGTGGRRPSATAS